MRLRRSERPGGLHFFDWRGCVRAVGVCTLLFLALYFLQKMVLGYRSLGCPRDARESYRFLGVIRLEIGGGGRLKAPSQPKIVVIVPPQQGH